MVDGIAYHSPDLFNGIDVMVIGLSKKVGTRDYDADCVECIFHLCHLVKTSPIIEENPLPHSMQ
jgi:hypothetical protein